MLGHSLHARLNERANGKITLAISSLLEAIEYADDTNSNRWDFAVPIAQLRNLSINDTDLRWLVKKGIVEHSREVTVEGDDSRQYNPTGKLTFCHRSCFVLTDLGIATAQGQRSPKQINDQTIHKDGSMAKPVWTADTRELRFDGRVVKQFKWQAINQETVLTAFEEEEWPVQLTTRCHHNRQTAPNAAWPIPLSA